MHHVQEVLAVYLAESHAGLESSVFALDARDLCMHTTQKGECDNEELGSQHKSGSEAIK